MANRLIIIFATVFVVNQAYAGWNDSKVYIGAEIGKSRSQMNSGGFNTAGPHENTNDDRDSEKLFGIKLGLKLDDRWRFDVGYRKYGDQNFVTDSFEPPTPTFFYDSKIKTKAVIASAYYNIYKNNKLDLYGGAGLGAARTKVSTTDFVVEGSGSDTNLVWQVELGADYSLTESLTVNAGLRYVDLGKTKIDLNNLIGNDAGDFSADLTSKEVFLGLRYIF